MYPKLGKRLLALWSPLLLFCLAQGVSLLEVQAKHVKTQQTVSGRVINHDDGTAIVGAVVKVKGTDAGTSTDADGRYTLNVPAEHAVLVVSFVGFATQEIALNGRNVIDVRLISAMADLEEVVVVGYGTQKSTRVTGAIARVTASDLEERPVGRVDQALMGKLAGVQVQQVSGAPGKVLDVKVRGTSSINFANSPLYVVDGYPISGDLNTLNTNDIESIEVLKDAASAAIYGSRGANGVVLVTTKSGKAGTPVIQVDASVGLQSRFSRYDVLNRDEWIAYAIEERNNSWVLQGGSADDPNSARANSNYWIDPVWLSDPGSLPDNDWQRLVDRVAPVENFQLSASGANEKSRYYLSGNFFNQKGILIGSDFRRLSFRSNIESRVSDWINVGINLSAGINRVNDPRTDWFGGPVSRSHIMPPVVGIDQQTEQGGYYPYVLAALINPIAMLNEYTDETKRKQMLVNGFAEFNLAKGLKLRSTFGTEQWSSENLYFIPNNINRGNGSQGTASSATYEDYLTEHTLTYQLVRNNWDLDVMGGFTYQEATTGGMNLTKQGFADDEIRTLNAGTILNSGGSDRTIWNLMSFLGRANFSYRDRYLIAASVRRDGSSRFGRDNRWGWFPSVSLGWRMTEERFMEGIDWMSELKLRGSYGVAGNNNIGNFAALGTLNATNYVIGADQQKVAGYSPGSFSNTFLGWEKTYTADIGFDVGLFNNRVQVGFDFYRADTKDLLLNVQIPEVTGFATALQNVGSVRNQGVEFELNTVNLAGAFRWTSAFNISANRNKVLSLGPDGSPIYGTNEGYRVTITQIGQPIGSYYLFEQEGVFMNEADLNSHPHYLTQNVGDIKYTDYNNDGRIDQDDIHIVGNAFPDFFWGFRNTFSYKGLDLTVFMDGQQGVDILNIGSRSNMQSRQNVWGMWRNRWRSEDNPGNGMVPRAAVTENMTTPSTFWLFDGSYWSIRNITFGYTFPQTVLNRWTAVNGVRVFFSMDNVFMHDHYHGNPQTGNHANTSLTPNIDSGTSYPLARNFTLGLNVKF
ncbi:SusC/RagA family TonB-linked outer membrane protein [Parapedobacter luteus]|nr:TonB-dependent receptor [Parapedobacter luteus]